MKPKNPYYKRCTHLTWVYPTKFGLGNSYSRVKGICKIYSVDVYTIKRNDGLEMCCVSISPYTKQNCKFFKNKKNQTQLGDF